MPDQTVHNQVNTPIEHDYTFLDDEGDPIPLTGATVVLLAREPVPSKVSHQVAAAIVSAAAGTVKATFAYPFDGEWTWQFRATLPGPVEVDGVRQPILVEPNCDAP